MQTDLCVHFWLMMCSVWGMWQLT